MYASGRQHLVRCSRSQGGILLGRFDLSRSSIFLRWPGYDTAVLTQKTGVSVFVGRFCSKSVRFSGKTAMKQSLTHWQCAGKFAASSVISAGLERTDSMLLRSPSCVTFRCFPQSGLHDGKSLRLGKIEDGPRNILSSWICIHEEQRFT